MDKYTLNNPASKTSKHGSIELGTTPARSSQLPRDFIEGGRTPPSLLTPERAATPTHPRPPSPGDQRGEVKGQHARSGSAEWTGSGLGVSSARNGHRGRSDVWQGSQER